MSLVEQLLSGNRLALTRLLTQVENNTPEGRAALTDLFPYAGKAHLIGVTGAPGTGKSSLVNQLALHYRRQEQRRVAVVAVDPSSPFTGGAVLGDRVRMRDLAGDPGVFIRSMASRGSLGGVAQTTAGLVQVFDAAGYDTILIETVGAGQAEVEIARLAHTTLVVEAPGLGDDIQAIKAGILEIADILVVNKADRPGVENTLKALKNALELAHPVRHVFQHHGSLEVVEAADEPAYTSWIPPIRQTIATDGEGVSALAEEITRHAEHLRASGDWTARERSRLGSELEALLREKLVSRFYEQVPEARFDEVLERVYQRELAPWEAVKVLLNGQSK
jgi:LAO/AO transport system kinase